MGDVVLSVTGIPIRLPEERWIHIVEEHGELSEMRQQLLDTIRFPERILMGSQDELLALTTVEPEKWLIVVYREFADDGFIITAFMTRRQSWFAKRKVVWSR